MQEDACTQPHFPSDFDGPLKFETKAFLSQGSEFVISILNLGWGRICGFMVIVMAVLHLTLEIMLIMLGKERFSQEKKDCTASVQGHAFSSFQ